MTGPAGDCAASRTHGKAWESYYALVIPQARKFLLSKGVSAECAEEFAHDFFSTVIVQRDLCARLQSAGGTRMPLLRKALRDYYIEQLRRATAEERRLARAGETAPSPLIASDGNLDRESAIEIVREALRRTEDHYRRGDHASGKHWTAFEQRILRPILYSAEAPAVKDLAKQIGLKRGDDVSALLQQVRRRFIRHLLDLMGHNASTPAEARSHVESLLATISAHRHGEGLKWR